MRLAIFIGTFFSGCIASKRYGDVDVPFPDDFLFGVSSSAYQTEGAWDKDGRGEGIWDRCIHTRPDLVTDGSNADEGTNSYGEYKRDVNMLKYLGVDFYRFSVSWPRVLPDGRSHKINEAGIDYYNKLIDELLLNGIQPMVTLYHWDLPQALQDDGGFLNSSFPSIFENYANIMFEKFGDRVKYWVTFNEPDEICVQGYGMGLRAPVVKYHGYGEYICTSNLLSAHARAYHLYDKVYRPKQKGKIGIAISAQWCTGLKDTEDDRISAEDTLQFHTGYFSRPIFSKDGKFPELIYDRVPKDRLVEVPKVPDIRNTSDFLGVNHYDLYYITRDIPKLDMDIPSFESDLNVNPLYVRRWSKEWMMDGNSGFGKTLRWIQKNFNGPEIYITEVGMPSPPTYEDLPRVWYLQRTLLEVLKAIRNGIKIKAFATWSLMDNFEWFRGYEQRFGLFQVNFDHPNKTTNPRKSASVYAETISRKIINLGFPADYYAKEEHINTQNSTVFWPKIDFTKGVNEIDNFKNGSALEKLENAIKIMDSQVLTFTHTYDDEN